MNAFPPLQCMFTIEYFFLYKSFIRLSITFIAYSFIYLLIIKNALHIPKHIRLIAYIRPRFSAHMAQ